MDEQRFFELSKLWQSRSLTFEEQGELLRALHAAWRQNFDHETAIAKIERERDEARAEVDKWREREIAVREALGKRIDEVERLKDEVERLTTVWQKLLSQEHLVSLQAVREAAVNVKREYKSPYLRFFGPLGDAALYRSIDTLCRAVDEVK